MLAGVDEQIIGNRLLFHINTISPDIEDLIRHHLVSICHGRHSAHSGRQNYTYKRTLEEFLTRFNSKSEKTKIGMIGELLAHILIIEFKKNMIHASPYFNTEERSIRKGYDIILYDKDTNEIWITEVKAGRLHKGKTASETCTELIGTAKRDLIKRLNEKKSALWQNAIHAATVCLGRSDKFTDAIDNLLHQIDDQYYQGATTSKDRCVLLTAGLFYSIGADKIQPEAVKLVHEGVEKEKVFKDVVTLAFQKGTLAAVVNFLIKESGHSNA